MSETDSNADEYADYLRLGVYENAKSNHMTGKPQRSPTEAFMQSIEPLIIEISRLNKEVKRLQARGNYHGN